MDHPLLSIFAIKLITIDNKYKPFPSRLFGYRLSISIDSNRRWISIVRNCIDWFPISISINWPSGPPSCRLNTIWSRTIISPLPSPLSTHTHTWGFCIWVKENAVAQNTPRNFASGFWGGEGVDSTVKVIIWWKYMTSSSYWEVDSTQGFRHP